jgi:hypothetical protein
MSRARLIAVAMACLAAMPRSAGAQPATGVLTGTVTGTAGNRVSGVILTVQNRLTGIRSTATTDADGRYEIPNLPVEGQEAFGRHGQRHLHLAGLSG